MSPRTHLTRSTVAVVVAPCETDPVEADLAVWTLIVAETSSRSGDTTSVGASLSVRAVTVISTLWWGLDAFSILADLSRRTLCVDFTAVVAHTETKLTDSTARTIVISLTLGGRNGHTGPQDAAQEAGTVVIALAATLAPTLSIDALKLWDGTIVVLETEEWWQASTGCAHAAAIAIVVALTGDGLADPLVTSFVRAAVFVAETVGAWPAQIDVSFAELVGRAVPIVFAKVDVSAQIAQAALVAVAVPIVAALHIVDTGPVERVADLSAGAVIVSRAAARFDTITIDATEERWAISVDSAAGDRNAGASTTSLAAGAVSVDLALGGLRKALELDTDELTRTVSILTAFTREDTCALTTRFARSTLAVREARGSAHALATPSARTVSIVIAFGDVHTLFIDALFPIGAGRQTWATLGEGDTAKIDTVEPRLTLVAGSAFTRERADTAAALFAWATILVARALEVVYAASIPAGLTRCTVGISSTLDGETFAENASQSLGALCVDLARLRDAGLIEAHQIRVAISVIAAPGDHTSIPDAALSLGAIGVESTFGDL